MISILDMRSIKKNMGIIDPGFGKRIFSLYVLAKGDFWGGAELAFLELFQDGREAPCGKGSENTRSEYSNIIYNISILIRVLMSGARAPGWAIKLINAFTAPESVLKKEAVIEKLIGESRKGIIAGGETMLVNQFRINGAPRAGNTGSRRIRTGSLSAWAYTGAFGANKLNKPHNVLLKNTSVESHGTNVPPSSTSVLFKSTNVLLDSMNVLLSSMDADSPPGFVKAALKESGAFSTGKSPEEGAAERISMTFKARRETGRESEERHPMLSARGAALEGISAPRAVWGHLQTLTMLNGYRISKRNVETLLMEHSTHEAWKWHGAGRIHPADAAPAGTGRISASARDFVRAILSKTGILDVYKDYRDYKEREDYKYYRDYKDYKDYGDRKENIELAEEARGRSAVLFKAKRSTGGEAAENRYIMPPWARASASAGGKASRTAEWPLRIPAVPGSHLFFAWQGKTLLREYNAREAWKERRARSMGTAAAVPPDTGVMNTPVPGFAKSFLSKLVTINAYKQTGGASRWIYSHASAAEREAGGEAEESRPMPERQASTAASAGFADSRFSRGHSHDVTVRAKAWPFARYGETLLRKYKTDEVWKEYTASTAVPGSAEAPWNKVRALDISKRPDEAAWRLLDAPHKTNRGTERETGYMGTETAAPKGTGGISTAVPGFVKDLLSGSRIIHVYIKNTIKGLGIGLYSSAAQAGSGGEARQRLPALSQRTGISSLTGALAFKGAESFRTVGEYSPSPAAPGNYRPFAQRGETLLMEHSMDEAPKEHEANKAYKAGYIRTPAGVLEDADGINAAMPVFVRTILSKIKAFGTGKEPGEKVRGRITALRKEDRKAEKSYIMLELSNYRGGLGTHSYAYRDKERGDGSHAVTEPGDYSASAQQSEMLLRECNKGEAVKGHQAGSMGTESPALGYAGKRSAYVHGFVKALLSKIEDFRTGKETAEEARGRIAALTKALPGSGGQAEYRCLAPSLRIAAAALTGIAAFQPSDITGARGKYWPFVSKPTGSAALAGIAGSGEAGRHSQSVTGSHRYWPLEEHGQILLREHRKTEAPKGHEAGHIGTAAAISSYAGAISTAVPGFVKALLSKIEASGAGREPEVSPILRYTFKQGAVKAYEQVPYEQAPYKQVPYEQAYSELVLRSDPQREEKGGAAKSGNDLADPRVESNSAREQSTTKIKVINEAGEALITAEGTEMRENRADISKLADQVYKRLEERLRIERQRRGLFR